MLEKARVLDPGLLNRLYSYDALPLLASAGNPLKARAVGLHIHDATGVPVDLYPALVRRVEILNATPHRTLAPATLWAVFAITLTSVIPSSLLRDLPAFALPAPPLAAGTLSEG